MTTISPIPGQDIAPQPPLTQDEEDHCIPPFDPAIHLAFSPPLVRHSFTSLNLPKPATSPDMCFTEPFQLFSEEGVRMIRRDLLRKKVLDKHMSAWERAPCYIGGHEETATWIRDMWYHPAVTDCISKAFGLPLKVLGRRGEVGYVNIQLGLDGVEGVYKLGEIPSAPLELAAVPTPQDDTSMIDSWHRDSTQIVVVVMLSDTSTMIGGETAIRTGDGRILKARGGKMGSAVVMQGCHVQHAALRSSNSAERISMVTSYSFADPDLDDSGTSLRSMTPEKHDIKLIHQHFLLHKLEKLRARIDKAVERVKEGNENDEEVKREHVEPWVQEQIMFLKQTSWELFERYPKYFTKDVPEGVVQSYLSHI